MRKAIALCAIGVALSLFLYGFFLLAAVSHTASRADAERKLESVTARVSNLEQEYLLKTKTMTLERAREMGLYPPQDVSLVYVSGQGDALSAHVQY